MRETNWNSTAFNFILLLFAHLPMQFKLLFDQCWLSHTDIEQQSWRSHQNRIPFERIGCG